MAKYRKKPIVVEAIQWDGKTTSAFDMYHQWNKGWTHDVNKGELYIATLEGVMTASKGDWIIRGVNGEFYPCKPDIFEATYEKAR